MKRNKGEEACWVGKGLCHADPTPLMGKGSGPAVAQPEVPRQPCEMLSLRSDPPGRAPWAPAAHCVVIEVIGWGCWEGCVDVQAEHVLRGCSWRLWHHHPLKSCPKGIPGTVLHTPLPVLAPSSSPRPTPCSQILSLWSASGGRDGNRIYF